MLRFGLHWRLLLRAGSTHSLRGHQFQCLSRSAKPDGRLAMTWHSAATLHTRSAPGRRLAAETGVETAEQVAQQTGSQGEPQPCSGSHQRYMGTDCQFVLGCGPKADSRD